MDPFTEILARTVVPVIAASWLTYTFTDRAQRLREGRAQNLAAVVELTAGMRRFQLCLRAFGREYVDRADVEACFRDWAAAVDCHRHLLPAGWRHLPHSVRDATGTVFGGVSLVHVRPDAGGLGLCHPDAVWQDYADEYLDYAVACLQRWSHPIHRSPKVLVSYDDWLRSTGRTAPSISF